MYTIITSRVQKLTFKSISSAIGDGLKKIHYNMIGENYINKLKVVDKLKSLSINLRV